MTHCFSPPLLTQDDWEVNECGAEGLLSLLCCFVLSTQMELYDNQKSANIVSRLHTQRGGEAFKHLKEAIFPPQEIQIYLFWSYLFSKEFYALFMSVHNNNKKKFLNLFICYLTATKDKFYFHISGIFSSKGSAVGVVPHQLAKMSFRQLICLRCAEEHK